MISLESARKLKAAGLAWLPEKNDYFAVPDRNLDDLVFVLSDVQATIERIQGKASIAFQGASEWALDDLLTEEAVWLPREDQLRKALEAALLTLGDYSLLLECDLHGCRCTVAASGLRFRADSRDASEAYASVLLHLLESKGSSPLR